MTKIKKEKPYENCWTFNDQDFHSDDIGKHVGFVYMITDKETDKKYIGKKFFYSMRKSRLKADRDKKNRKRSESNWKEYYGSSDILKELIEVKGKEKFSRTILSLHSTEGDTNRSEVEYQWKLDVLYNEYFLNDCIGHYKRVQKNIIDGRRESDLLLLLLNRD